MHSHYPMTTAEQITEIQRLADSLHLGPVTVQPGITWVATLPNGEEIEGRPLGDQDGYSALRIALQVEARFRQRQHRWTGVSADRFPL